MGIAALVAVIIISTFQSVTFYQIFNAMVIWIQHDVSPTILGLRMPVPWYQSINAVGTMAAVPALIWIWQRQAARGREPDEVAKIGSGAWMSAASNVLLVWAIYVSQGHAIDPIWPTLSVVGAGIAWLYQWPILFSLVSRAAPPGLKATMMGINYLSLFASGLLVGWIGGFYENMSPTAFWTLNAAISAAGGLLMMLFGRTLSQTLRPT